MWHIEALGEQVRIEGDMVPPHENFVITFSQLVWRSIKPLWPNQHQIAGWVQLMREQIFQCPNERQFLQTCSVVWSQVLMLRSWEMAEPINARIWFCIYPLSYESGNWEVDERHASNVLNSLIVKFTSSLRWIKMNYRPQSDPAHV